MGGRIGIELYLHTVIEESDLDFFVVFMAFTFIMRISFFVTMKKGPRTTSFEKK